MGLFAGLKLVHVCCALLSVAGFALRGYWVLTEHRLCQHRLTRVLPHLVDSLLLATAVAMLVLWQVSPQQLPWVVAKILALLLYIALGMTLMRFAKNRRQQLLAYLAALVCAGYIITVAFAHSAWGPLALLG